MKKILFPLCIMMAILILVIGMTTVSFSWFEPGTLTGSGLKFSQLTGVTSTDCIVETFKGSMNQNGMIKYDDKSVTGEITVNSTDEELVYFKTVVTNKSPKYDTNISLYLKTLSISGGSADIAVIYPTNTYRTYSVTQNDLHIVRNAYISVKNQAETDTGTLTIEWFVKCDSGSANFNVNDLYLMYN